MTDFPIDEIINGECVEEMRKLPDSCIDLIIADPPYNLSKGENMKYDNSDKLKGMGGSWNKVMEDWDNYTPEAYTDFSLSWLKEAQRILKSTGSMWVFGTYHNIGIVNACCQNLGIEILNEVIWYKRNAFPNLSARRLTASHENILWCDKGGKKREYYFNYDYAKNGDFSYDSLKTAGNQMRSVWDIPNNKEKHETEYGKHPTQKPLRILKRIIGLSSKEGDLVFTPFAGAGSECVAAKSMGRRYLGVEIDGSYCEIARTRLEHTENEALSTQDEQLRII